MYTAPAPKVDAAERPARRQVELLGRIAADIGDTRLNNYLLEHSYRWLRQAPGHADFWSPPMFYPATGTMAFADVFLSAAPLYWPWRLLGAAPDTAFQLWMLTVGAFNYLAAYLLLRRVFAARP